MTSGDQQQPRAAPEGQPGATSSSWVAALIREGNYDRLDEHAQDLGKALSDDATRTQVRNIFGTVKRLEALKTRPAELMGQLTMLRPRLAYAVARALSRVRDDKKPALQRLKDVLTEASKLTAEKADSAVERVPRLVDLMEAILCYSIAERSQERQ